MLSMSETSIGNKKNKTTVQTRCILSGGVYLLHRSNHFPTFLHPQRFLKDMFCWGLCLTMFALIEQVCKSTRAAFGRAGVQEAFGGLRRTQQKETGKIASLRGEKNEPCVWVRGIS